MRKGWFKIPGVQDGDRTVEEQMTGLDAALAAAKDKAVLDLGSAEGLIAREFARAGAFFVQGMELKSDFVDVSRDILRGLSAEVMHCNLSGVWSWPTHARGDRFDVVLMLAILHKLAEPVRLIERVTRHRPALIVVRLPIHSKGVIIDARSNNRPCDAPLHMKRGGYFEARRVVGPRGELVCYYEPEA